MLVKNLIVELLKQDPDKVVIMLDNDIGCDLQSVKAVQLSSDGDWYGNSAEGATVDTVAICI